MDETARSALCRSAGRCFDTIGVWGSRVLGPVRGMRTVCHGSTSWTRSHEICAHLTLLHGPERGRIGWRRATGDGALGFWKALDDVTPTIPHQRCTVHKTATILNKLAKSDLREIWAAPDRATAEAAIATFADKYGAKYDKAVTCLVKDRDALPTFYDFPAEQWDHLRTSNPIENVFATVRHRTVRTEGALSQNTARLMVFKLVMAAAKTRRRLKGENQLPKVVPFTNGVESPTRQHRAPPDHRITQIPT